MQTRRQHCGATAGISAHAAHSVPTRQTQGRARSRWNIMNTKRVVDDVRGTTDCTAKRSCAPNKFVEDTGFIFPKAPASPGVSRGGHRSALFRFEPHRRGAGATVLRRDTESHGQPGAAETGGPHGRRHPVSPTTVVNGTHAKFPPHEQTPTRTTRSLTCAENPGGESVHCGGRCAARAVIIIQAPRCTASRRRRRRPAVTSRGRRSSDACFP